MKKTLFTLALTSLLTGLSLVTHAQSIPALEGQLIKHRGQEMTVLGNIELKRRNTNTAQSESSDADNVIGRVGHFEVSRNSQSKVRAMSTDAQRALPAGTHLEAPATALTSSPYLGVAYFKDSQEVGLIGKEITLKFKNNRLPARYQALGAREIVAASGVYVLPVSSLSQWMRLLPELETDSQVSLVEANIVTRLRTSQ